MLLHLVELGDGDAFGLQRSRAMLPTARGLADVAREDVARRFGRNDGLARVAQPSAK